MFSHVMVGTNNMEASKRFYDAVLGALGYAEGALASADRCYYRTETGVFALTTPLNGESAEPGNGGTIGFAVTSTEQADAWHAAGLAHGGTACEDPPGLRPNGLYLAYLRDPDGNKVCVLKRPD